MCFGIKLNFSSKSYKKDLHRHEFSQIENFENFKTNSIIDDYKCFDVVLGEGSYGKVWLCESIKEKSLYAVKGLEVTKKSLKEIQLQIIASQNCDYIVKIKDVYINGKYYYVVMEYMAGGELFDRISQDKSFNEKTIEHLHNLGIAHRDVKSENILFSSKDDDAIVKLTDFGFAKETHNGLNTVVYSLEYAPPEILKIEKRSSFNISQNNYDNSCDIWSLGVLMFLLCYGKLPFSDNIGTNFSIKNQILKGKYSLKNEDHNGNNLTKEVLMLIKGMIELEPSKRLTIKEITSNKWIRGHEQVPKNKIKARKNLYQKCGPNSKKSIIFDYNQTLTEMRLNDEAINFKLKNLRDVKNPLLRKRLERKKFH